MGLASMERVIAVGVIQICKTLIRGVGCDGEPDCGEFGHAFQRSDHRLLRLSLSVLSKCVPLSPSFCPSLPLLSLSLSCPDSLSLQLQQQGIARPVSVEDLILLASLFM